MMLPSTRVSCTSMPVSGAKRISASVGYLPHNKGFAGARRLTSRPPGELRRALASRRRGRCGFRCRSGAARATRGRRPCRPSPAGSRAPSAARPSARTCRRREELTSTPIARREGPGTTCRGCANAARKVRRRGARERDGAVEGGAHEAVLDGAPHAEGVGRPELVGEEAVGDAAVDLRRLAQLACAREGRCGGDGGSHRFLILVWRRAQLDDARAAMLCYAMLYAMPSLTTHELTAWSVET